MNKRWISVFFVSFLIATNALVIATINTNTNENTFDMAGEIEIGEIQGGLLRVKPEIQNVGDASLSDISWNITVTGGILNQIDSTTTGEIDELEVNESEVVRSNPLLGFGPVTIQIDVDNVGKAVNGFLLFFFVIILPEPTVDFEIVASGLSSPLAVTHAGDGSNRLFIVDQTGFISIVEDDTLLEEPFLDISDKLVELDTTYDERGLLGLAFHPEYSSNGRFFIYYSSPKQGPGIDHESILAEYTVSSDPNSADANSEKILFRVDQPEANHNGGQLVFGPDGYLYIGLGDGGGAGDQHGDIGNGQNISTYLGSILRIDVDSESPYAIPPDNPFVGTEGLDEIYAYGLRNPWRFSFDTETDVLWAPDVGQDEWEEINLLEKGENYGWRIYEATHPYDPDLADELGINISDLAMPIHEYSHDVGRSITGGYVYRGNQPTSLQGKYIFGDWSTSFFRPNGKLYYLEEIEPDVYERFDLIPSGSFNRFVQSFGEDEQGELYLCSKTTLGPSGTSGDVRKILFL